MGGQYPCLIVAHSFIAFDYIFEFDFDFIAFDYSFGYDLQNKGL